jgi:Tol biopolymer transport system component
MFSSVMRFRKLIIYFLLLVSISKGQYYFSKNKVQYENFSFKTYETDHFTIYFIQGGENLLEFASRYAEDFYKKLSSDLSFTIKSKIPLIIYNSSNQFMQTNVILDIIEESVGGFSELFKNRVVVPFDGSYENFRRVLEHEITHIFEFELFYRSRLLSFLTSLSDFTVPLWVMEGFSEFLSNEGTYNVEHEVFLRDIVLYNRFIGLDRLSDEDGYINYRIGQAFFDYISEKYGRKKVFDFIQVLRLKRNLTQTFKVCFGTGIPEFSAQFEEHLKIRYYPQITKRDNFTQVARLLTDHQKDNSIYNTTPAISPSGTKVAMLSDRTGYNEIYVISAIDGRVLKRLVKGERSGGFEAFPFLKSAISWFPNEKALVVVTKRQGKDELVIVSYPEGKIKKRLRFNLDALYSPTVSPNGKWIVFAGLKNGYADIYLVNIDNEQIFRLTYDYYDDRDPSFNPTGNKIVFISDRPKHLKWQPGAYGIFELELDEIMKIASHEFRDTHSLFRTVPKIKELVNLPRGSYQSKPLHSWDGKYLVFVRADSSYNLYFYSISESKILACTDFPGSIHYPSLDTSGRRLVFSYFQNLGWDIGIIEEPFEKINLFKSNLPAELSRSYYEFEPQGIEQSKILPYQFILTSDYAVGQASYSTGVGFSGQLTVSLSDVLGNHQFYFTTDLYQSINNSEFLFNYWYLPKRADWAVALFQFFEYPSIYEDYIHLRRNRGLGIFVSYPFDKFSRVEFGNINYLSYNEVYRKNGNYWHLVGGNQEKIFLADQAYVYDNTLWNDWGPRQGIRFRLENYQTIPGSSRKFYTFYFDLRNYWSLGKRYIFASRFYNIASFGNNKEQFIIGGELVRGYQYYEFFNNSGSILSLLNLELRHPFIDKLKFAFPFPVEIANIRGVTFIDFGCVCNNLFTLCQKDEGLADLKIGVGGGIRLRISYFLLKLDIAKPLSKTDNRSWKWYLSLGTDF